MRNLVFFVWLRYSGVYSFAEASGELKIYNGENFSVGIALQNSSFISKIILKFKILRICQALFNLMEVRIEQASENVYLN